MTGPVVHCLPTLLMLCLIYSLSRQRMVVSCILQGKDTLSGS